MNAGVLSRYRDVAAALRDPLLVPAVARSTAAPRPVDAESHQQFRAAVLRSLAPPAIEQLDSRISPAAIAMVDGLPRDRQVDVLAEYARPWSLQVAALATGVPAGDCARLGELARAVFDAACEPYDESLEPAANRATAELGAVFRQAPPWYAQMFVALACSLPAFLGLAWMELLRRPEVLRRLRRQPELWPAAIDELLRLAGPARAQFRQSIATNQLVILRLDLANRDAEEFPSPDEFHLEGRSPHLAFGGGLHACVAGVLVRCAALAATRALFRHSYTVEAESVVEAFAVRYAKELVVHRVAADTATHAYRPS